MQTVVVRKYKTGTLLPLADLTQLMGLNDISAWRFREITLHGSGLPFGMSFDEFEAATRATSDGLAVSDQQFQSFLSIQISPFCLIKLKLYVKNDHFFVLLE